jgi:hypothetical protein
MVKEVHDERVKWSDVIKAANIKLIE